MVMIPVFPTALWLEHLGCRKYRLRFPLSWRGFGLKPHHSLQNWYTLKWWEKGRILRTFAHLLLLHFSFLFCLVFWRKWFSLHTVYKCCYAGNAVLSMKEARDQILDIRPGIDCKIENAVQHVKEKWSIGFETLPFKGKEQRNIWDMYIYIYIRI